MRFALLLTTWAVLALLAPAAEAATVSVEGDALRVVAGPGETNSLSLAIADDRLTVSDGGAPESLAAGPGCELDDTTEEASCPASGVARVELDAGDADDEVDAGIALPTRLAGGPGSDRLAYLPALEPFAIAPGAILEGGEGEDSLEGGPGDDLLDGGDGDDVAAGGDGDDRVLGDRGRDGVDGGAGNDRLEVRDRKSDSVACGTGRDTARGEVLDSLDIACERVDYGPPGRIGRLLPITGGGRFVRIPGQSWARVDRRILPDVLYLIRRYKVQVGEGYAPRGHNPKGEHPLGLAVDLTPGPGGSWRQVAKLARWAEPRQYHPRFPFRWVGWNGDKDHGDPKHCKASRGCPAHLHLSWDHTPGRPRRPVRTVWVWQVRGR
jgi:hypothetical protein